MLKFFQKGFNYSQDGPGNRLVIHLSGCNLKCPWCSNPEGMDFSAEANEISPEELLREILSCRPMFFDGGGVTFTGGEASLQGEELLHLIPLLRENGISVAIETNGAVKNLSALTSLCDCVMIDYKHPDAGILKSVTGGDLSTIEENIRSISKNQTVHLRIPLVNNFNSGYLREFSAFFLLLKENGGKFDVEILPYHEYGREKWRRCGKEYTVKDGFVTHDVVMLFAKTFEENGITVIKT